MRQLWGGQLAPPSQTQSEWYLADLEVAERAADSGDISYAARLMRAARRDGVLTGVLSTLTDGLVRLPKTFEGDEEIVSDLRSSARSVRSTFDEMFPPSELAKLVADGLLLGVGVGELREVPGRTHPVFVRLEPEWLRFDWVEGQWWYRAVGGEIPVTPGDGRWILHTPGGRIAPWDAGKWKAVGRAYIRKENASLSKDNYEATLANPALVAETDKGASDSGAEGFFRRLVGAWGLNTIFGLKPGYKLSILESNGRGHESFEKTIAEQNTEIVICIAGQTVTTEGGRGFSNTDIHRAIKADLIQSTADSLAFTLNSQGIPAYVAPRWGEAALANPAKVSWDITPARDRASEAATLVQVATALTQLSTTLGDRLDVEAMAHRFGVPLRTKAERALPAGKPSLKLVEAQA